MYNNRLTLLLMFCDTSKFCTFWTFCFVWLCEHRINSSIFFHSSISWCSL